MTLPEIGTRAPDFEALNDLGERVKLSDYRGQEVVLYFYPRADTPGCTKEACGFRDDYDAYERAGVAVLGVSPDTVKNQAKFKEKFNLPFVLVADENHEVAETYGVWGLKKSFGKEYEGVHRTTFIIDSEGRIANIFEKVDPAGHSAEILSELKS